MCSNIAEAYQIKKTGILFTKVKMEANFICVNTPVLPD